MSRAAGGLRRPSQRTDAQQPGGLDPARELVTMFGAAVSLKKNP